MINPVLGRRIAKLESATAALRPARTVLRHIINGENDAARQARIRSILETSDGNIVPVEEVEQAITADARDEDEYDRLAREFPEDD